MEFNEVEKIFEEGFIKDIINKKRNEQRQKYIDARKRGYSADETRVGMSNDIGSNSKTYDAYKRIGGGKLVTGNTTALERIGLNNSKSENTKAGQITKGINNGQMAYQNQSAGDYNKLKIRFEEASKFLSRSLGREPDKIPFDSIKKYFQKKGYDTNNVFEQDYRKWLQEIYR